MKCGYRCVAIALVAIITLVLIAGNVQAAEVEAFVGPAHTSDLFRGRPFNDQEALQLDGLFGGITITAGKHRAWEIDLAHGAQRIDHVGKFEQASTLTVRFYPGRLR